MSRVQSTMTRMKPAPRGSPGLWRVGSGRARRLSKSRGSGRVGSGGFQNHTGGVGSGQEVFKILRVGSGRVGSRRLEILVVRVGSGRVKTSRKSRGWGRVNLTRENSVFFLISYSSNSGYDIRESI